MVLLAFATVGSLLNTLGKDVIGQPPTDQRPEQPSEQLPGQATGESNSVELIAPQRPQQTPVQAAFSLGVARSQLSDIEQFPPFVSDVPGILVGSSEQLSPTQPSQPSLSWIRDQVGTRYGSNRLVEQWHAYQIGGEDSTDFNGASFNYVDVVVNEQIWDLFNYFERYAFIVQFGTAAKSYGYHLRVFHGGDIANLNDRVLDRSSQNSFAQLVRLRGAHFCSFSQAPWPIAPDPVEPDPIEPDLEDNAKLLACTVELEAISGRPEEQRNLQNLQNRGI